MAADVARTVPGNSSPVLCTCRHHESDDRAIRVAFGVPVNGLSAVRNSPAHFEHLLENDDLPLAAVWAGDCSVVFLGCHDGIDSQTCAARTCRDTVVQRDALWSHGVADEFDGALAAYSAGPMGLAGHCHMAEDRLATNGFRSPTLRIDSPSMIERLPRKLAEVTEDVLGTGLGV